MHFVFTVPWLVAMVTVGTMVSSMGEFLERDVYSLDVCIYIELQTIYSRATMYRRRNAVHGR